MSARTIVQSLCFLTQISVRLLSLLTYLIIAVDITRFFLKVVSLIIDVKSRIRDSFHRQLSSVLGFDWSEVLRNEHFLLPLQCVEVPLLRPYG